MPTYFDLSPHPKSNTIHPGLSSPTSPTSSHSWKHIFRIGSSSRKGVSSGPKSSGLTVDTAFVRSNSATLSGISPAPTPSSPSAARVLLGNTTYSSSSSDSFSDGEYFHSDGLRAAEGNGAGTPPISSSTSRRRPRRAQTSPEQRHTTYLPASPAFDANGTGTGLNSSPSSNPTTQTSSHASSRPSSKIKLKPKTKSEKQQQILGPPRAHAESPVHVKGQLMTANSSSEQSFVPPLTPSSSTNPSTKTSGASAHHHSFLTASSTQERDSNSTGTGISPTPTSVNTQLNGNGSGSRSPKSVSATATRFIRRVASAPNAKGWFFSSSSASLSRSTRNNGFLSPADVPGLDPLQIQQQQQQLGQSTKGTVPAVPPIPSSNTEKGPDSLETVSSSESMQNSTRHQRAHHQSLGKHSHPQQSNGKHQLRPQTQPMPVLPGPLTRPKRSHSTTMLSAFSKKSASLLSVNDSNGHPSAPVSQGPGLGPGRAAFRRTYSSNSIKVKSVSIIIFFYRRVEEHF